MDIRITHLSLVNFKCFRSKEFDFAKEITTVRGRNGEGKTTIADAILFCLFGKNTGGQSDLDLFKTQEDKKVIPHLDHSVELTIETTSSDDATFEVKLKRCIKEECVKKHGASETVFKNNTVEYYVNGETYKKAEYEKFVASLIDERIFKVITNPLFFPSLAWKDQREFLVGLVGSEISTEVICDGDEKLKKFVHDVLAVTHDKSNEEYIKHLKSQKKDVKDKLERIPIRLEEQNKALPEKLDWDAVEKDKADHEQKLKDIDAKIANIQKGNGADIKRASILKDIADIQKNVSSIEESVNKEYSEEYMNRQSRLNEASLKFNEALNNQKLMEQTIQADKRLIERCEETIDECDKTRNELLSKWPTDKFTFDKDNCFCPTCGQYLPEDQVAEKREKMRKAFNLDIERRKNDINTKGQKNNETKATAENELAQYKEKLSSDEKSLAEIKENINTIFSNKAKIEKETIKPVSERLSEHKEYNNLVAKVKELKTSLDNVVDDNSNEAMLNDLKAERVTVYNNFCASIQKMATKSEYERITSLIESIQKEEKDLIDQLSELEQKEDIATLYQNKQNQVLEEHINKHFKLVQWRLFKTVNNGGDSFDEPFCECYVKGIPYHKGLNNADKINAGLDICEAICHFYGVSAPIVIDNAESNLNIYKTTGQQIRLQVYESDLTTI